MNPNKTPFRDAKLQLECLVECLKNKLTVKLCIFQKKLAMVCLAVSLRLRRTNYVVHS